MIKNICRKILEDSPFYGLDNKQMGEVVDKLVDFIKKSKRAEPTEIGQLTSPHQALIRRLRDEYRLQNEIKLHDTIDDLIKETEIMKRIFNTDDVHKGLDPWKKLMNFLWGGYGDRFSLDYRGKAKAGRMLTMMLHELEQKGLLEKFRDGPINKEIYKDYFALVRSESDEFNAKMTGRQARKEQFLRKNTSGNDDAWSIAETLYRYDGLTIAHLNKANARIVRSPERLFGRAIDKFKIRRLGGLLKNSTENEKIAFQEWRKLADEYFNYDEMFEFIPPKEQTAYLKEIFDDLYNGNHVKSLAGDEMNFGYLHPINLGRKVSKRTRVRFKDGESLYAYMDKLGIEGQNLPASIAFSLEQDGRNIALLEGLGTNPTKMLRKLTKMINTKMKKDGADKYAKFSRKLYGKNIERDQMPSNVKWAIDILDGSARQPENATMAAIGSSTRSIKNMALLGFATIRSINDVLIMSLAAKRDGIPWRDTIAMGTKGFIQAFEIPLLGISANQQQRQIASLIGLGPRALMADVVNRFTAMDSAPGFISKMQRAYFKMNLLTYWNDALKTSYTMMLSHHLANNANKSYASSIPEIKRMLDTYGINPEEWDIIRNHAKWKADDGNNYMSPDRLDDTSILPDDVIRKVLQLNELKQKFKSKEFYESLPDSLKQYSDNIKEQIDDLKFQLADNQTRRSPAELERKKQQLRDLRKEYPDAIKINQIINSYFDTLSKKATFDANVESKLRTHYRSQEAAQTMAHQFLQGMDSKMMAEFEWVLKDLFAIGAKTGSRETPFDEHDVIKWLESVEKGLAEKKEWTLAKKKEWEDWRKNPRQKEFQFFSKLKKEGVTAEGKRNLARLLEIVSESPYQTDIVHRLIAKSWREEADALFKGKWRKSPEGPEVWEPPLLFSKQQTTPKDFLQIFKDAERIEKRLNRDIGKLGYDVETFRRSFVRVGEDFKKQEVQAFRRQLTSKLETLYLDRNDHAVIIPGAREKSFLTLGTQSGTILGEAMRFIAQFKSFPVTILTKVLNEQVSGKGIIGNVHGRISPSEYKDVVKFLAGMTALGAVTSTATDWAKNKTTRDTWDPESSAFMDFTSKQGWNNLVDAFVYGGGAGFYGDLLAAPYGSAKNFSAMKSLLGPTLGQYDDIMDVTLGVLNGDPKAKRAYTLLLSNTPGANLFYTRSALDYLFLYQLQDIIDPGYHRRAQRRMRRDTAQQYRIQP